MSINEYVSIEKCKNLNHTGLIGSLCNFVTKFREEIYMNKNEIFELSFQIIMNSGDARSMAMEAISQAKNGEIEKARTMIKDARAEINKAHRHQTSLIQAEANGEKNEISVLLIHSQDHLMNGMTVLDMAEEFIDLYEVIKK